MALGRDDLTYDKGNIGYGTMESIPEPVAVEGSAGDPTAETATSGIVNTDASAELAQQIPNIVVPVNQSSDSDDSGLTVSSGNGITSQVDLNDIINKDRLIGIGLAQVNPILGLAYNTYKYFDNKKQQEQLELQAQLGLQSSLDDTDPADVGFTSVADQEFAETGDYDVYSDTPTGPVGAQFGEPTYADPGVDAEENQPTYTAPAPAPGPVYYDYSSDSGSSDSGGYQGDDSDQEQSEGGRGSRYAVGGIVRLRKNKQNSRIHDRRKRLAMGGIVSLHG